MLEAPPLLPSKPDRPRRVFITVAEVSADQHAAHLIHSLKELDPTIIVEGLGGPAMRAAGAIIHHETVGKAAMGLSGVYRVFEMFDFVKWTRKYFAQNRPDLQICCDSPEMNFHFAKLAHGFGTPVLFYIAPQLWAWREWRMTKLRKWVDHVACILPFEEKYFRDHGIKATFVGHPLFDELPARPPRTMTADFSQRGPVIGLLPGSRKSEAAHNFGPMLKVADQILAAFPKAKFLVPTTPATHPVVSRLVGDRQNIEFEQGQFDLMVPRFVRDRQRNSHPARRGTSRADAGGLSFESIDVARWAMVRAHTHVCTGESPVRFKGPHRAGVYSMVWITRCNIGSGDRAVARSGKTDRAG